MLKSDKFRTLICGHPVIIIKEGQVLENQLKRLRISYEDLYSLLRQQEVFDIKNIKYAIVETNGSVSLLKYEEEQQ